MQNLNSAFGFMVMTKNLNQACETLYGE